jgi:glycosyltransferase involved in cell wall biosynthesis
MACGIPVIVTPFCGIRSLVDGRAGLVINPEKEQLAAALRLLFDDKLLYARLKQGCREITLQLSWDHLTEQMECYYKGVLAQNSGLR